MKELPKYAFLTNSVGFRGMKVICLEHPYIIASIYEVNKNRPDLVDGYIEDMVQERYPIYAGSLERHGTVRAYRTNREETRTIQGNEGGIINLKYIFMSRYFCLCPGGIKSDKDADVRVESFREIQKIINDFGDAIPKKFSKLRTKHILDESPVKFPYWGKVYMVLGTTEDGNEVPLGYCNFAKKWHNSFSTYSILLYFIFALSIFNAIYGMYIRHFSTALWCIASAILICGLLMQRRILIRHKTTYLLK